MSKCRERTIYKQINWSDHSMLLVASSTTAVLLHGWHYQSWSAAQ
jgi:hypothetical protein